ncbi:MAG: glycosyltransferase family 1 protein [Nannocystaceae bacterium]
MTGNYVNVVDGVALTLNRMVRFLERCGDEVAVFAPGAATPALEPAGQFIPVRAMSVGYQPEYRVALGLPRSARKRLDAFRPDLVHLATPDLLGWAGMYYARRHDLPVVTSFHSNIVSYMRYSAFLGPFQGLGWAYFRRFYRRCDQIYVPTPSMANELRRHGIGGTMRLWSRGVDTDRFSPARRSATWRLQHGIAPDEVAILFVARLRWEKGLRLLAEVFNTLDRRGLSFRPVIVGQGVGHEALRRWLPRAVMPGHLEGEQLAAAYASSDVFLYPCETDTFGNVTLEAMASGLPAVCADAPGAKSLVRHGETGWLAKPRDAESFAEHTAALLADVELRRRMADAALTHARRFTWDACMGRLADYYDECLGRHRSARRGGDP